MGDRIAQLRHKKGLSQAALGKRLGLSASAIGMYEQGRREPSICVLISLAREFDVTTDYLLTGSAKKARFGVRPTDSPALQRLKQSILLCAAWLMEDAQDF